MLLYLYSSLIFVSTVALFKRDASSKPFFSSSKAASPSLFLISAALFFPSNSISASKEALIKGTPANTVILSVNPNPKPITLAETSDLTVPFCDPNVRSSAMDLLDELADESYFRMLSYNRFRSVPPLPERMVSAL